MDDVEAHETAPPYTVEKLIAALNALPGDTLVAVGDDGGIDQPLVQQVHVRLDEHGRPKHICTADTPHAVEIVLL